MWKEDLKFFNNNNDMNLKRIERRIKNLSYNIDWIGNNDNFGNAGKIGSLINTISNNRKFYFCTYNVYSMMKSFDKGFIVNMNMR